MSKYGARPKINHPLEKKPFLPPVSLEQFLRIEAGKPETYSGNELVDAVAVGFQTVKPLNGKRLAESMCVDQKKLSSALELLVGYSFSSLRYRWVKYHVERFEKMDPKPRVNAIAHYLGFTSNVTLWEFLKSDGYRVQKRLNVRKDRDTEYQNYQKKYYHG